MESVMAAILVLVLLPCDGHVHGGTAATIRFEPVVAGQGAGWIIDWRLEHASLSLATGRLDWKDRPEPLTLQLPRVRALTAMTLHYDILHRQGDQPQRISGGQAVLWVHPQLDRQWVTHLGEGAEVVVATDLPDSNLVSWLQALGLKARQVTMNDALVIRSAKWLVVEETKLSPRLVNLVEQAATRGTKVIWIGGQSNLANPVRYGWAMRVPSTLEARLEHPLLTDVQPAWLAKWDLKLPTVVVRVIDEQEVGVAGWHHVQQDEPSEKNRGERMPSIDHALVWTRQAGDGHVVGWRLPVGEWSEDPRAELMFRNAMIYLINPPTLMKVQRTATKKDNP